MGATDRAVGAASTPHSQDTDSLSVVCVQLSGRQEVVFICGSHSQSNQNTHQSERLAPLRAHCVGGRARRANLPSPCPHFTPCAPLAVAMHAPTRACTPLPGIRCSAARSWSWSGVRYLRCAQQGVVRAHQQSGELWSSNMASACHWQMCMPARLSAGFVARSRQSNARLKAPFNLSRPHFW